MNNEIIVIPAASGVWEKALAEDMKSILDEVAIALLLPDELINDNRSNNIK